MEPLIFPNHILDFYRLVYFKPFTLDKLLSVATLSTKTSTPKNNRQFLPRTEIDHQKALINFTYSFNFIVTSFVVFLLMFVAGKTIESEISIKLLLVLTTEMLTFIGIIFTKLIKHKEPTLTKKDFIILILILGLTLLAPIDIPGIPIAIYFSINTVSLFLGILFGFELGVIVSLITFSPLSSINVLLLLSAMASILSWVIISIVIGKKLDTGAVVFMISLVVSFLLFFIRFPFYIYELIQTVILNFSTLNPTLVTNGKIQLPILWDELILFPLPWLDKQLVNIALLNRQTGLDYISVAASSIRQSWAARNATVQLIGEDIKLAHNLNEIAGISSTLAWLPDESRSLYKSLLLGMEEISAHARAALESSTLYNKQERLHNAFELTSRIRSGLILAGGSKLAEKWGPGLKEWEFLFEVELRALKSREIIPNVFVAGSPLASESKVFKGRNDLFRILENELSSAAEQHPTLLLFGARRTGKTSVIKQLPTRLGPQVIPVEIDLQSISTATHTVGYLNRIVDAIKNSFVSRHVDLSELSRTSLEKDPYSAFENWIECISREIGDRRLLLALDEYEALEDLITKKQLDENFFKLLRSIIQHHRKIILLFSGAHTLEDLPPIWSHYLVNVSVLKVNLLNEYDARELITKPIPEFNLVYETGAVERILEATSCHPYLIQLTCRDLVNYLNDNSKTYATIKDIEKALSFAITSGTAYFNDLYYGRDSDKDQQIALSALAYLGPTSFVGLQGMTKLPENRLKTALRRLVHRDVLRQSDGNYSFQVELVKRWVESKI